MVLLAQGKGDLIFWRIGAVLWGVVLSEESQHSILVLLWRFVPNVDIAS